MRIVDFQLFGFQSFQDSGLLRIQDGFNIVVGQNNSGKSSLLQALNVPLKDDRHRNENLFQEYMLPKPRIDLTISVSGFELKQAFFFQKQQIGIPTRPGLTINNLEQAKPLMDSLFETNEIDFKVCNEPNAEFSSAYPSHALFEQPVNQTRTSVLLTPANGEIKFSGLAQTSDTLPTLLFGLWKTNFFLFSAERYNIGRSGLAHATRLQPNAANLPSVLSTLQGERGSLFEILVEHMREIFPSFGNLSVRPFPANKSEVEVLVWPTREMLRPELGFSLSSSGTGISQTLAILTAAMTLDKCVIAIDEINSFLHPAATKALIRILSENYSSHQYIISTHAAEVISFSNNNALFLVRKSGYQSYVQTVDLKAKDNFRDVAELLGISMTDVFAADQILWVEGPTEELCFPLIYKNAIGPMPRGLAIACATPGDFRARRRDRSLIYEIYTKISKASSPLITTVGFSFDAEDLSAADITQMKSESKGALSFLPRRHLECYVVHSGAIAAFLTSRDVFSETIYSQAQVEACLKGFAPDLSPPRSWNGDLTDPEWLRQVDAANLINKCCTHLSEARVVFRKKLDTLDLLKFVMQNDVAQLQQLIAYVRSLFKKQTPV